MTFLTTTHIQHLLHHKNPTRIQQWLQQLTQAGYIISDYTRSTFAKNTKPAVYCLATKSKKILAEQTDYSPQLLSRIYKEKARKQPFKNHCLFIADVYLLFMFQENGTQKRHFSVKTDLVKYDYFPRPLPDAYLAVTQIDKKKTRRYFFDVFDDQVKRFELRGKVKHYFRYTEEGDWQAHADTPVPMILFVCPDEKRMLYLKKFITRTLTNSYETALSFFLTTKEKIMQQGLKTSIWEKVKHEEESE